MARIKSVTVLRSLVDAPTCHVHVCENEDDFKYGWNLAKFEFSHWNFKRITSMSKETTGYFATFKRVEAA